MSGNRGSSPNKGGLSETAGSSFSIDSESAIPQEIPSITRLLDRKKLERGAQADSAPEAPARSRIRASERSPGHAAGEQIQHWHEGAEVAPPPHSAQALAEAWKQASAALWVVVLAPRGEGFGAHGILGGSRTLRMLWNGFMWGKSQAPQSFALLGRKRMLELTQSSSEADARALRAALALDPLHNLYIIAAGENPATPAFLLVSANAGTDAAARALQNLEARIKSSRIG